MGWDRMGSDIAAADTPKGIEAHPIWYMGVIVKGNGEVSPYVAEGGAGLASGIWATTYCFLMLCHGKHR